MKPLHQYTYRYTAFMDGRIFDKKHNRFMNYYLISGHPYVTMYSQDRRKHNVRVANYIYQTSYCDTPAEFYHSSYVIINEDGNPLNCRYDNLRYISKSDNFKNHYKSGADHVTGSRTGTVKLTEEQVLDIRALKRNGAIIDELSKMYKVSPRCIRSIVDGTNWKHLL